ncbi:uncharacterized protein PRCAT00001902001 [Priceomyces carsonii]|uniref:uncharacterized protein n=1 Tax=Priceomyces carsonii TaxID=28549 RepID=UPI002EDAFF8D|nr:unnamed protein product [Priceomyces carsonii]
MTRASFWGKITHRKAVTSTYRSLIRSLKKLEKLPPSALELIDINGITEEQSICFYPHKHVKKIYSELNYAIREGFLLSETSSLKNPNIFTEKFLIAIELEQLLAQVLMNKRDSWSILLKLLDAYRDQLFVNQQWRLQYLRNKQEIDINRNKELPVLMKQTISPSIALNPPKDIKFKLRQRLWNFKLGKLQLRTSYENSEKVLRRYIKPRQQRLELPNPFLLPYVKEYYAANETDIKSKLFIPGSTKRTLIKDAYDPEYVESIIKPSIEYDINIYHHFNDLKNIVNVKGPYRVQINLTEAGPMSIPFIRMPYPRLEPLKKVALDIKHLMKLSRIVTVWELSLGDQSLSEPKFDDGSYSVRGSKGWGEHEKVWPKYYYETLAEGEGIWESFVELAKNNKPNTSSVSSLDIDRSIQKHILSWKKDLNLATKELRSQLDRYFQHYKSLKEKNSPIFLQQSSLQKSMNSHYDHQIGKYETLLKKLKQNNIFKHSDLLNLKELCLKSYPEYHQYDMSRNRKNQKGIPLLERTGMNKRLGDLLDDVGFHSYRNGESFDKKFKF